MELLFIRHGEPGPDGALTEKGKREARLLAERLAALAVLLLAAAALLLRADYSLFAVIAVFLFYVLRHKPPLVHCGVGVAFLALTRTMGFYCATGFSLLPLLLYNGRRGRGLKWLFYAFYPGHLLLLYALKRLTA